jgi:uncharacterized protein
MFMGWVRAHPITTFLVWFFTVGWAIAFVPTLARNARGIELSIEPFIIVSTWVGLLLPIVVITHLVDGPAGVHALLRRVLRVRVAVGWYVLAMVAVPLIAVLLALLAYGPPNMSASALLSTVLVGLLVQSAIGFATTNLWEETAWMGFVQARLQVRHGPMLAVVITAALFALQHLPLVVENASGLIIIALLFVLMIPFRALVGWVYNRTDSLFVVGLLHAIGDGSVAGSIAGVGLLPRLYEGSDVTFFSILAQVVIGVVVIAATRAHLGRPSLIVSTPQAKMAPALA